MSGEKGGNLRGNFGRMMGYVTGFWQLKAVFALILISTFLDVQMPMMIGDIIDLISSISSGGRLSDWDGGLIGILLLPASKWIASSLGYDPSYATLATYI